MKDPDEIKWHELSEAAAVDLLKADTKTGLTQSEVTTRLGKFGESRMTTRKPVSAWLRSRIQ